MGSLLVVRFHIDISQAAVPVGVAPESAVVVDSPGDDVRGHLVDGEGVSYPVLGAGADDGPLRELLV